MSGSGCKNVKCLNNILPHSDSYHFWLLPESAVKTQSEDISNELLKAKTVLVGMITTTSEGRCLNTSTQLRMFKK